LYLVWWEIDKAIDLDYLKDCLKFSCEERFIRCAEFSEFCSAFIQHHMFELGNDNPDIFTLT
jgi:hypothetical protein